MKVCSVCQTEYSESDRFCSRDGTSLPETPVPTEDDPLIGQVLGGRLRVLRLIGSGGMGNVYLARHELLDREVAIKMVRRDLTGSAALAKRFMREAKAGSRVEDPHVVTVLDFGRTQDGRYYLVMEHLVGTGLDRVLERHGRLAVSRAIHVTRQVAGALCTAHACGIVHRDLKPQNVWLVQNRAHRDFVKVLDFGLAKMRDVEHQTSPGQILGSPFYMAPEQVTSRDVDGRADLYALGAVLYELLTGHTPFSGSLREVVIAHEQTPPEPPSRHEREIPPELDEVVLRCLAKSPDDRYQSATELGAALEALRLGADEGPASARRWIETAATTPAVTVGADSAPSGSDEVTGPRPVSPGSAPLGDTVQTGSVEDMAQLRQRMILALVEYLWPEASAPVELQRILAELRRRDAELEERQTEIALLTEEIEEIEVSRRLREAKLRDALVDLGMDRARRQEQIAALEQRDAVAMQQWGGADAVVETTGQIHAAHLDAHRSLEDVDEQIRGLDYRLGEVRFEIRAHREMREKTLALRQTRAAELAGRLERLFDLLSARIRTATERRDATVTRLVTSLERIEKRIRGTESPAPASDHAAR